MNFTFRSGLNIVTQQNTGASEEIASSAEELLNLADNLKEEVSFFKINLKK